MSSDFGTGKTIFVLAIVVGCFAVLWPKVFYPMLIASQGPPSTTVNSRQGSYLWKQSSNKEFLNKLCYMLEEHQVHTSPPLGGGSYRWESEGNCFSVVKSSCGLTLTEMALEGFKDGAAGNNLTDCMKNVYGLTASIVAAAAPPVVRHRHYTSQATTIPRPERPTQHQSDMVHPALRDKGRALPQRTIDKQARPGPMPGVRPPMGGGAGHIAASQQGKGGNSMSVIMPLYTVGIIIFFMYTIMKVLFKKCPEDEEKMPKLKDFHMDPEYRKYVFEEEYLDSGDGSGGAAAPIPRDNRRPDPREASATLRRRTQQGHPEAKIEDEQMDQLRRRLEDTERAMERLMSQMGSVSDKLTAAKITEVLSQAQAQAKLLKSEANGAASKGSSPDMDEYEVIQKGLASVSKPTS